MTRAAKPYRPANGTEGDDFHSEWCANCQCDDLDDDSDGQPCPILGMALGTDIGEDGYPPEWIYDPEGEPVCTAFLLRDGPGWADPYAKREAQRRYDALARDPVTGRPVIA